jgi:hypothetical protein
LWVSGFRVDPCGFVWVFSFCGLALMVPVYTPGVLKCALHFLIKSSSLSKKKKISIYDYLCKRVSNMGASFSFSFSLFSYVGVYVNAFILHDLLLKLKVL